MTSVIVRCQQCGERATFVSVDDGMLALHDGRCWGCQRYTLTLEQTVDPATLTQSDRAFLRQMRIAGWERTC